MLSSTNSLTDIKAILEKDYAFFDFADEPAYDASITIAIERVKLLRIQNHIGPSIYDAIALKDKVDLSEYQNNIYQAEVYYSAGEFLSRRAEFINYSRIGETESMTTEGYSQSVSGKYSGAESMANSFWSDGNVFMSLAGYDVTRLVRC